MKNVEMRSLILASAAFEDFKKSIVLCLSVCVVHQKVDTTFRQQVHIHPQNLWMLFAGAIWYCQMISCHSHLPWPQTVPFGLQPKTSEFGSSVMR